VRVRDFAIRVELAAGEYPLNRIRIVIGALSLSSDWISV